MNPVSLPGALASCIEDETALILQFQAALQAEGEALLDRKATQALKEAAEHKEMLADKLVAASQERDRILAAMRTGARPRRHRNRRRAPRRAGAAMAGPAKPCRAGSRSQPAQRHPARSQSALHRTDPGGLAPPGQPDRLHLRRQRPWPAPGGGASRAIVAT